MDPSEKINCRGCRYYYITWDKNFPNGCRAYGLKSKEMPSLVVYKSSGKSCMGYDRKR